MVGVESQVGLWGGPFLSRCGARIVTTYHDTNGTKREHTHECHLEAGHLWPGILGLLGQGPGGLRLGQRQADYTDWHLCRCDLRWP